MPARQQCQPAGTHSAVCNPGFTLCILVYYCTSRPAPPTSHNTPHTSHSHLTPYTTHLLLLILRPQSVWKRFQPARKRLQSAKKRPQPARERSQLVRKTFLPAGSHSCKLGTIPGVDSRMHIVHLGFLHLTPSTSCLVPHH